MTTKEIVKYSSYVIGAITVVSLVNVAPAQVVILSLCALANLFYVNE